MSKLPEKTQKYIQVLGFTELDEKNNFLFKLSPQGDLFKVNSEDIISQEIVQIKVGDKLIQCANIFVSYSDEIINMLKKGTGRYSETIYEIGPNPQPDIVVGGAPKGGGGKPGDDFLKFSTKTIYDDKIIEIIEYKFA
ncbi:hypothetical protein GCM10028807_47030 [Spirosoma daeguense]